MKIISSAKKLLSGINARRVNRIIAFLNPLFLMAGIFVIRKNTPLAIVLVVLPFYGWVQTMAGIFDDELPRRPP